MLLSTDVPQPLQKDVTRSGAFSAVLLKIDAPPLGDMVAWIASKDRGSLAPRSTVSMSAMGMVA
jgi:hypothetical protein